MPHSISKHYFIVYGKCVCIKVFIPNIFCVVILHGTYASQPVLSICPLALTLFIACWLSLFDMLPCIFCTLLPFIYRSFRYQAGAHQYWKRSGLLLDTCVHTTTTLLGARFPYSPFLLMDNILDDIGGATAAGNRANITMASFSLESTIKHIYFVYTNRNYPIHHPPFTHIS